MYAYVYERLGENVGPSLRKLTYTLRQHSSQAYLSQRPEELCSWLAIWLHLAVNWTCRLRRLFRHLTSGTVTDIHVHAGVDVIHR